METRTSHTRVEAHFDQLYTEVDGAFGSTDQPQKMVGRLPDNLKPGSTVLELGAGQGRNSLWLARHGFRVDALDLSQVGIDLINRIAAREHLMLRAAKTDICEHVWKPFDAYIATYVLHHLAATAAENVIRQMKTFTKPHVRRAYVSGWSSHWETLMSTSKSLVFSDAES